jgi:hypothetical protein
VIRVVQRAAVYSEYGQTQTMLGMIFASGFELSKGAYVRLVSMRLVWQ